MARGCLDVICLTCGRAWCLRGCTGHGPSLYAIERFYAAEKGRVSDGMTSSVMYVQGERCACGSNRVVHD